jgi:hypothetical protein
MLLPKITIRNRNRACRKIQSCPGAAALYQQQIMGLFFYQVTEKSIFFIIGTSGKI